ncbi:Uncharacterised protein [Vibrio cholerae]|nr:Uncharacterised protein [Vibrio cholerae]
MRKISCSASGSEMACKASGRLNAKDLSWEVIAAMRSIKECTSLVLALSSWVSPRSRSNSLLESRVRKPVRG